MLGVPESLRRRWGRSQDTRETSVGDTVVLEAVRLAIIAQSKPGGAALAGAEHCLRR